MLNHTNQDFVLTVFMKSAAESKHVGTNDTWMKLDMEGRPSVGPMMGVFHSSQVSPYLFTLTSFGGTLSCIGLTEGSVLWGKVTP